MKRADLAIALLALASFGAAADEAPDLALLEFLGEWQEEGEWLDPLALEALTRQPSDEQAPQGQERPQEQDHDQ